MAKKKGEKTIKVWLAVGGTKKHPEKRFFYCLKDAQMFTKEGHKIYCGTLSCIGTMRRIIK